MTATELRRELSTRNLERARGRAHEVTYGAVSNVIYAEEEAGGHGNFFPASWRRIQANPDWARRLAKAYTAGGRVARRHDRRRGELECAASSDALLMNIFCCPGVLRRPGVCELLGVAAGERPSFGVRTAVPLRRGLVDRTEVDLAVGDLLVEAKLTESGFQVAREALLARYVDLPDAFDVDDLPRTETGAFASYQLIRAVLAAHAQGCRFAVLCDRRRGDLVEQWFRVLRAVRGAELRSRLQLVTWQELAPALPQSLQNFLGEKYGIEAGS